MKLNLTTIFRKKSRSMSKSEPLSFSSSSSDPKDTPKSVLPSHIPFRSPKIDEISGDCSDHSSEINWNSVEVFNLFDKDGDGKISRDELEQVLCRLGCQPPTEEELVMMMEEADHDGDGCISFEEFSALSLASGPACGTDLRDAFTVFDRDGDGRISAEELLEVFEALGDEGCTLDECRRMIGGVDTDGDGFVCFDDFARMMLEQR